MIEIMYRSNKQQRNMCKTCIKSCVKKKDKYSTFFINVSKLISVSLKLNT